MVKTKKRSKKTQSFTQKLSSGRILIILIIVALFGSMGVYLMAASNAASPVKVDAATYNILGQHHDAKSKLPNWAKRKARISATVSKFNPGIIGMQEVIGRNPLTGRAMTQRGAMVKIMSAKGYSGYVGSATNTTPIFWKRGTFRLLSAKEVRLVGVDKKSKGASARFLTQVRLNKNGKNISVFNYHFNHYRSQTQQLNQIKKLYPSMKKAGDYVIFTGDFNNYDLKIRNLTGLWRSDNSPTVDHILVSSNISRRSWAILANTRPAASDHRLLGSRLTLK
jgi:endonuclease/exonuclease/phosphatase family metal-dependent hydrolase